METASRARCSGISIEAGLARSRHRMATRTMTLTPPLPKARLEALTDGIFAVTMTILVLNLEVPAPSEGTTVFVEFSHLVDRLDNYLISFVVLAVFWIGHLRLMRRMHEPDVTF